MKKFHLAQVLCAGTGVLVPTPGMEHAMDGVYDILSYLVDDDVWTHAIPRIMGEVKPYMHEQFPWLDDEDVKAFLKNISKDNWQTALGLLAENYGEWHEVRPIHGEDHEVIGPIEEMMRLKPDAKIITVDLTQPDEPSSYGDIDWKADDDES